MNYNQSGIYEGIEWSVTYLGDREFKLVVGDKTEIYTCNYPTIFGIDVFDQESINLKLDEMQGL